MRKFTHSLFVKSFLVGTLCAFSLPVMAQSSPNNSPSGDSNTNSGYTPEFTQGVMNSCRQSGVNQGVSADQAQKTCMCFVKNLETRITFEKLQSIVSQAQKSGQSSPEVQAILQSCRSNQSNTPSQ